MGSSDLLNSDPRADLESLGLAELHRITTELPLMSTPAGRPCAAVVGDVLALLTALARGRRSVILVSERNADAVLGTAMPPGGEATLAPTAVLAWRGDSADLIRDWQGAQQPFMSKDGGRLVLPHPAGGVVVEDPGYAALSTPQLGMLLQLAVGLAATAIQMAVRTRDANDRARSLEQTRHRLREQAVLLRDLAVVDDLTRLYNRRFLDSRLDYELQRYHRYGAPLSLVLLDVDHFKSVNDEHGHLIGDVVLQHLAQLGLSAIRRVDLFARFGGEEFALLLPSTDVEGARLTAERLRQTIGSRPALTDIGPVPITISAGVATARAGWTGDAEHFIRCADQALYRAKAEGRNRVVLCDEALRRAGIS